MSMSVQKTAPLPTRLNAIAVLPSLLALIPLAHTNALVLLGIMMYMEMGTTALILTSVIMLAVLVW
jgi:hypothetical protein